MWDVGVGSGYRSSLCCDEIDWRMAVRVSCAQPYALKQSTGRGWGFDGVRNECDR